MVPLLLLLVSLSYNFLLVCRPIISHCRIKWVCNRWYHILWQCCWNKGINKWKCAEPPLGRIIWIINVIYFYFVRHNVMLFISCVSVVSFYLACLFLRFPASYMMCVLFWLASLKKNKIIIIIICMYLLMCLCRCFCCCYWCFYFYTVCLCRSLSTFTSLFIFFSFLNLTCSLGGPGTKWCAHSLRFISKKRGGESSFGLVQNYFICLCLSLSRSMENFLELSAFPAFQFWLLLSLLLLLVPLLLLSSFGQSIVCVCVCDGRLFLALRTQSARNNNLCTAEMPPKPDREEEDGGEEDSVAAALSLNHCSSSSIRNSGGPHSNARL